MNTDAEIFMQNGSLTGTAKSIISMYDTNHRYGKERLCAR